MEQLESQRRELGMTTSLENTAHEERPKEFAHFDLEKRQWRG